MKPSKQRATPPNSMYECQEKMDGRDCSLRSCWLCRVQSDLVSCERQLGQFSALLLQPPDRRPTVIKSPGITARRPLLSAAGATRKSFTCCFTSFSPELLPLSKHTATLQVRSQGAGRVEVRRDLSGRLQVRACWVSLSQPRLQQVLKLLMWTHHRLC